MKAFVFLLILVNLLFYAYSQGYLGTSGNPDAARVASQIEPERIRIVSSDREPPLPAANGKAREAAVMSNESLALSAAPGSARSLEERICLAWDKLAAADADRLNTLVAGRFPDFRISRRLEPGESGGWWIYISPQVSKAEADKKAGELRQLGVSDYFIIQDGPNRFAISLGVFSGEKGGQDRLAELKSKGVRSARLMQRPGKDGTISLLAEGPAGGQAALLGALSGSLASPAVVGCP
jgi:hypothetical protein